MPDDHELRRQAEWSQELAHALKRALDERDEARAQCRELRAQLEKKAIVVKGGAGVHWCTPHDPQTQVTKTGE